MIANKKSVARLSRYKNALHRFKTMGLVRIFSDNLADAIGVTSSQVRKDFSVFGITGSKRGGYQIDDLFAQLNNILGKDQIQEVIIAGVGNIGAALLKYNGFEKEKIKIVAAFDIDAQKWSDTAPVPVYSLDRLIPFVNARGIKIGIIAVPESAAQMVFDRMVTSGIRGVLNFAPLRLRSPKQCVINSVNLVTELENVIFFSTSGQRIFLGELEADAGAHQVE
ncbi:MAG: redox-sensing transcriptional repressor Rex [Candidatus Omnitrophica bacterium]|nr:redox-sensing transcriptional repressor Rex [Candidatus Omnitrophota bacterium]